MDLTRIEINLIARLTVQYQRLIIYADGDVFHPSNVLLYKAPAEQKIHLPVNITIEFWKIFRI